MRSEEINLYCPCLYKVMKYENFFGRYVPVVYCGNCHKKMEFADMSGDRKNPIYLMVCDDVCLSWCKIQGVKIIDYGRFET